MTVVGTIGKVIGTLLLICVITGVILICLAAGYIRSVVIPQAHLEANFVMNQTSTIYYMDSSTGEYVEHLALHGEENRVLVDYEDIPQDLINATVAIEDRTFREHNGVNWRRTIYGVILMFTGQDIQGGSTITQQLIKNSTQYDDVTVKRKIWEIFTALDFDATYSKEQIMEWYLNYIFLGDGCYGVGTAAQNYFGKDVSELTLAECASIISITNNPTIYGPNSAVRMTNEDGEVTTGRERNKQRQELVLWTMWDQGIISEEEYQAAVAEELHFVSDVDEEEPATIYNWYDEQVITDVMNDLMEQYGYSSQLVSDMVYSGGLRIYACVDQDIQDTVESVYSDRSNLDLTSNSGQEIQSAIVIVDPDGNVVGLAGSLGEKTTNRGWNYASRSQRQPGSSIKPLSVYAPALENGLITPASTFDDYPVQVLGGSAWPLNNPLGYRGLMTVAAALEVSSNPVAVRTLQTLGVENSFQFMEEKFHIDLEDGVTINGETYNDYGASQLALGGLTNGVRVIDMAAAYSVFPRNGLYLEPRTYTRVTRVLEDGTEEVLLDNTDRTPEAVLSEETTWYINDMLQNVVNGKYGGATGTGARISGMTVAGKTGTTNSNNDKWFVGYTPYYTAAVWVGYSNPERISYSGNPAVTMWRAVMGPIHEGLENQSFPSASSEQRTVSICRDSGLRATEACLNDPRGSRAISVTLFADDVPAEECSLHTSVEVCTDSPVLDADGTAIEGLYHLAGEYCPREADESLGITEGTVQTIGILNYERELVGGVSSPDGEYLYSFLEAQGTCDVHTTAPEPPATEEPQEYDPNSFVISDPSTWPPVNDPRYENFDPENPDTWPTATVPPTESSAPGGETGTPSPSPTPVPTPTPTPTPAETPPDEPYIPADGT